MSNEPLSLIEVKNWLISKGSVFIEISRLKVKKCQTFTIEKKLTYSKHIGKEHFSERKYEEMHYTFSFLIIKPFFA